MSTITTSPTVAFAGVGGPASRYRRGERPVGGAVASRRRRSAATYRARRAVAGAVAAAALAVAVVVVALLVGVLASSGGRPASAAGDSPAVPAASVHVARAGDSLWSIAGEHRGSVGLDRYVDALVELNGGTVVHVGQAVRLP